MKLFLTALTILISTSSFSAKNISDKKNCLLFLNSLDEELSDSQIQKLSGKYDITSDASDNYKFKTSFSTYISCMGQDGMESYRSGCTSRLKIENIDGEIVDQSEGRDGFTASGLGSLVLLIHFRTLNARSNAIDESIDNLIGCKN